MHDGQLARLAALIADSPHNLVSRGERAAVRERHIDEAVAVGALLQPAPGERWLDLGTGGGLPGLALAVCYPHTAWTLLDATAKKVAEVDRFAVELGLRNVTTVRGRAETLARGPLRASFRGVVARALAPLVVLVELARGFLERDGCLAAVKGPTWATELEAADAILRPLGLGDVHSEALRAAARPTWLVTMRATGPLPAACPRPDGVPRAHPFGRHPA